MRGYFKYSSYSYDNEKLTLTVNDTILDPVYLTVERIVMLQSSAVDSLIVLHKAMNVYQLSKLKLDDFTLSMNISIAMEKVHSMAAIQFGTNVIIGLGVNSGFKLLKVTAQMEYVHISLIVRILLISMVLESLRYHFLLRILIFMSLLALKGEK